jgi:hypothetical protein
MAPLAVPWHPIGNFDVPSTLLVGGSSPPGRTMTRAFLRLVRLALLGTALVPVVTVTCDWLRVRDSFKARSLLELSGLLLALAATAGLYAGLRRVENRMIPTRVNRPRSSVLSRCATWIWQSSVQRP